MTGKDIQITEVKGEKRKLRSILWMLVAWGILFIVMAAEVNLGLFGTILQEIGIAALIAAILGFTVHQYFSEALARDVFVATINHIFPKSLNSSIQWIYQFSKLATESITHVRLDKVGDDVICLTGSMERTIQSISLQSQDHKGHLSIDDWGVKGFKSSIIECYAEYEGKVYKPGELDISHVEKISQSTEQFELSSEKSSKHFSKWTEYKRINDALYITFSTPTKNPVVHVEIADGLDLDCIVEFGSHSGTAKKEVYANIWRLEETYLPTQHIRVRWWPKNSGKVSES